MKINIVLFQPPNPPFKMLNSYLEVIESLAWGLSKLNIDYTFRINEIDHECINIVFGWTVAFRNGFAHQFPDGSILYNLEQYSNNSMKGLVSCELAAERFQIWDYSTSNIKRWNELNPKFPVYYARIGFSPNLIKLPLLTEDIDICFIGSIYGSRSEKILKCATEKNFNSVVTVCNVWGRQRDEFIARSKVLLNISTDKPDLSIYEVVRTSFYIANKKAVISELTPKLEIESDLRDILKLVPASRLGDACDELVHDEQKRKRYAQDCFDVFSARDVRDVIRGFFS